MKQSPNDPTLKDYFTQNEARQWIRHLEKIIESHEKREKVEKGKYGIFLEKYTQIKRKYKRLLARLSFLQEEHPDIDFGLRDFKEHDG